MIVRRESALYTRHSPNQVLTGGNLLLTDPAAFVHAQLLLELGILAISTPFSAKLPLYPFKGASLSAIVMTSGQQSLRDRAAFMAS